MVKIEWYEGGRAEETPCRICVDEGTYTVDEVVERALIYDQGTRGYRRMIVVRCGEKHFSLIKEQDQWALKEE